jgi:hypothetical protein
MKRLVPVDLLLLDLKSLTKHYSRRKTESWGERRRSKGNKICNSWYRVWDRDNMGTGEMDIE